MDSNLITGLTGNTAGRKTDREPLSIDDHHLPKKRQRKTRDKQLK